MGIKELTSPVQIGGTEYETVAASQTNQVLGGTGAKGDFISRAIITVVTAATSTVTLTDGTTGIVIMAANTAIGCYSIELGMRAATGPWKITTGAGATVIAVGQFSA
jgi:hypothetical protein